MTRALLGAPLVFLLAGCAHGALGSLPVVQAGDASEIAVIRPEGFVGCGTTLSVTVDGRDAFGLWCGEHVVFPVPSGERILGVKNRMWFVEDENTTAVATTAGRRYYLRLDISGWGGPVLNRIAPEVGEALIAKTKRLE